VMGTTYIGDDGVERPVDPKTVGQFTGILDSNEKEVYTGDIFEITANPYIDKKYVDVKVRFVVIWNDKGACLDVQVHDVDPANDNYDPRYGLTIGDIQDIMLFFHDESGTEISSNIHEEAYYDNK